MVLFLFVCLILNVAAETGAAATTSAAADNPYSGQPTQHTEPVCCSSMTVGGLLYSLTSQGDNSAFDCVSNCRYEREDDEGRTMFCFRAGPLEAECHDRGTEPVTGTTTTTTTTTPITTTTTTTTPRTTTCQCGITIIAIDSLNNNPITTAKGNFSLHENGGLVPIALDVQFGSDGKVFVPVSANGVYQVQIQAPGFIPQDVNVTVDCTAVDCENKKLVALSPLLLAGQTRIIMTWDANPDDVDIHVMAIKKNDSSSRCKTYYSNQNGCPMVSQDVDNTDGGLNGAETVTLLDNTINSQYRYLIAVEDYQFDDGDHSRTGNLKPLKGPRNHDNGTAFLNSGVGIYITNGIQNIDIEMKATSIEFGTEFYLFGCLDVHKTTGSFIFTAAPEGTFFNGHNESSWLDMLTAHCPF